MNPVIEQHESNVRSYCRSFPTTFVSARGSRIKAEDGRTFIDFFAGAGTLNYGHNEPHLKAALLDYIVGDGITHGLDMATQAKVRFLESFSTKILGARGLDYKVMFPGPTGTNAVEAAVKVARKVTGRTNVVAFTNGFHGMTLGSLALTGNKGNRGGAGVALGDVTRGFFDGYLGDDVDTIEVLDALLSDPSSGVDAPAAFIVETVQGEGGLNAASFGWLQRLKELAHRHGALLIIDDIQAGCGRTGTFFSFEPARVIPDIVTLSKSLSGMGLPMSLVLFRPELDVWSPGEHNGTFRGNNHAFVTAREAVERFWDTAELSEAVARKATVISDALGSMAERWDGQLRGRGMMQGVAFEQRPNAAGRVSKLAYDKGLICETSGPRGEVLKILAPLNIPDEDLEQGLSILDDCVDQVMLTAANRESDQQLEAK